MSAAPDYIRWYPGALALACSLLSSQGQPKERAKDIVQQAVTQLIERGGHLGVHRQAWFFTVVRNACIDELRHQQKYPPEHEQMAHEPVASGPAEHCIAQERQQQIKHALQTLTFEQREILLLRDLNDLSYAEIAQVLTINAGTVMSRLHRARMAMRAALQQTAGQAEPIRSSATYHEPASQPGAFPKEAL